MRSIDASARLTRVAESMLEELEEATPIHGVPIANLGEEDSAVIAISDAMASNGAAPKRRAVTEPGRYHERGKTSDE